VQICDLPYLLSLQENSKDVFYFAHAFICDHLLSSLWLAYFSVHYWMYTDHNGERVINSEAQRQLIEVASDILDIPELSTDERHRIAQDLWNTEKGHAAAVIIIGWVLKVSISHSHLERGALLTMKQDIFCSYCILLRPPPPKRNLSHSQSFRIREATPIRHVWRL
jgi:hypothetical protein